MSGMIRSAINFAQLAAASTPAADADLMILRQNGVNKKMTVGTVRNEFALTAQAAAVQALAYQNGAQGARDAALIGAGVYATEVAGRAAVADGAAFKVQGFGDVAAYEYRRVSAGVASTLIATYPSASAVDIYRGTTEAGSLNYSSFNSMVKPGYYWNSRLCAQTPYGTVAAVGSVHVQIIGPDQAIQTFYKDGLMVEAWSRTFVVSTAVFAAWKRIMGLGQLTAAMVGTTSRYRGSTDSAVADPTWGTNVTNWNLLVSPGFYWNPTRACSNTPYGVFAALGTLDVQITGPDLGIQTYYKDGLLSEVWTRSFVVSTSVFSAWEQNTSRVALIPASRLADNFPFRKTVASIVLAADRDYNKFILPGAYTNAGTAAYNGPAGTAPYTGTLIVSVIGSKSLQSFYVNDSPDDVWTRTFDSAPTFTPWVHKINRNAGMTELVLGDSISAGTGAGPEGSFAVISANQRGTRLTNLAVGGASMAYRPGQTAPINAACFVRITAGSTTAGFNIVRINYGTNDGGNNVPLGVLGSTNEEEFYGAMNLGYANIMAVNPTARVIFNAPTFKNPEGNVQQYRDAIRAFCVSKNLTCLEPNKVLGWNPDNAATFVPDNLHPGTVGHPAYGRWDAGAVSAVW